MYFFINKILGKYHILCGFSRISAKSYIFDANISL